MLKSRRRIINTLYFRLRFDAVTTSCTRLDMFLIIAQNLHLFHFCCATRVARLPTLLVYLQLTKVKIATLSP